MIFKKLLDDSYQAYRQYDDGTKLEFLSSLFDLETYEGTYSEKLAKKMLRVCLAITKKENYQLIGRDPELFYTFVNMPFVASKIEWGVSIRGCWWSSEIVIDSTYLGSDGKQLLNIRMTSEEFGRFVQGMVDFVGEPMECEV